nr:unnamed protein product [Spirometra erinaceieuropaei]
MFSLAFYAILMAGILDLGVISKPNTISVCKQRHAGCVSFSDKQDNFKSYRRCLTDCRFRSVIEARPTVAYECTNRTHNCNPLTYNDASAGGDDFLDWVKCLQICDLLSTDKGEIVAKFELCDHTKSNCFSFSNSNNNLQAFVRCYENCQVYQEGKYNVRFWG